MPSVLTCTGTDHCGYYRFEMAKDKMNREEIVRAELHLFQIGTPVSKGHYNVHIHYLLRAKDVESPIQLTFKHVVPTLGWKTFDITPIAEKWKQHGWVNHGFKVKLTKGDQKLPCDGVFSNGRSDTEPSLVVYTHDHDSKFFERLLKKEEKSISRITNQHRRRRAVVANVSCHRKKLIIKRETLSSNRIKLLIPFQFDAGTCEGHCKRIEQNEPRVMSYASVVSIHYLHTGGLRKAPSRCCVPTSYDTIKMVLFMDIVTRQRIFKKDVPIVAKHCGCL